MFQTERSKNEPTIQVAGKPFDVPSHTGRKIVGTKHIVVDGKVLCGNISIVQKVENEEYHIEDCEFPTSVNTCGNCTQSYLSTYGSRDPAFETASEIEAGDWVEVRTPDRTFRGRRRFSRGSEVDSLRSLRIVLSDEPVERWTYGIEDEVKIHLRENKYTVDGEDVEDLEIEPVAEPENHVDARTREVLADVRECVSEYELGEYGGVKTVGKEVDKFAVSIEEGTTAGVETIVADLEPTYTVGDVTYADEREHSSYTIIGFSASDLF